MADDVPSAAATSGGEAVLGHRFLWLSDVHLDPYYGTSRAFRESYDDGTKCDDSDDGDEDRTTGSYGCDSPPALVLGAIDAARREFKVDGEENGPSFVIVTGDAVRHGIDQLFASGRNFEEGSESRVENDDNDNNSSSAMDGAAIASYHDEAMIEAGKVMGTVASYLRTAFPNATVVICLGNNDVVPDYYLELYEDKERREDGHGNGDDGGMPTPQNAGMLGVLYDALVGDDVDEDGTSSSILTYEDMSTFLRGGYYHRTFHDGSLIVLSLNTVLYSSFHGPMMHRNVDDPGGQFEWMRTTLDDCRRRRRQMSSSSVAAAAEDGIGCSAMIVGHVPPAMGSYRHQQLWKEGYIRTYYEIVKEYDNVVIGQLFGHLHSDEFRVGIADDDDDDDDHDNDGGISTEDVHSIPDLSTPLLLGSSVTPLHGNDPSFRIVTYDRGMRRRWRGEDGGMMSNGNDGNEDGDNNEVEYRIVDYESYAYSAIGGGDANNGDDGGGGWSRLYTFSEAYGDVASDVIGGEGLSSGTFRAIVRAIEGERWGGEGPTLRAYRSYKLSGARREENQFGAAGTCNSSCRDDYICIFRSATTVGFERCIHERSMVWYRVIGEGAPRFVVGVLIAVAFMGVAFVKCHRMRKDRRKHYVFAPSVHEEVIDDGMDVRDREML